MRAAFAADLIAQVGAELGLRVELEPEFGFVGEVIFPNGKRHLFRNANFNVNPAGSVEIAKDKSYTCYFLGKAGFQVPQGKAFFSDALNKNLPPAKRRGMDEALRYAQTIGFPVYVKPNNLSQGVLVAKATNEAELLDAAQRILKKTHVMLVEHACVGRDYRVVVLGQDVISAYERIPLGICGDGHSTVQQLLCAARDALPGQGRPNAEIDVDDYRIDVLLARRGATRASVPALGEQWGLLDNANLSSGGTSVDVTSQVHASFNTLAVQSAAALGLTLAGVDFICADITRPAAEQAWVILEVNGAPGLDNYAALGTEQAQRVRTLYRRILQHLAQA